ncbi:hypothetical protein [Rossellomorea sp. DUT-2]|uniref:hypothetical protein n=1 Tax=Rossellomorea sp. DUT-2 TaxID=3412021 RepID=UPI003D170B49
MEFKKFLMNEYKLGEKSARDYVGRFNGLVNKGIYNGESVVTPSIETAIEKEYKGSKGHYMLALKRYIEFQSEKCL